MNILACSVEYTDGKIKFWAQWSPKERKRFTFSDCFIECSNISVFNFVALTRSLVLNPYLLLLRPLSNKIGFDQGISYRSRGDYLQIILSNVADLKD